MQNELMTNVLLFATTIAVIVTLALETVKRAMDGAGYPIRPKLVPAIAFLVGVAIGAAAYPFTEMDMVLRIWSGGIAGWMASGLYDTVKKTMNAGGK